MEKQTPRQFIAEVATQFADAPAIEDLDDGEFALTWTGPRLVAGVTSGKSGSGVFLDVATYDVTTVAQAAKILKMIFNDDLVAMTTIALGGGARVSLVRADDPTAAFDGSNRLWGRADPLASRLVFRSWTGGADFGDEPTAEERGVVGEVYS